MEDFMGLYSDLLRIGSEEPSLQDDVEPIVDHLSSGNYYSKQASMTKKAWNMNMAKIGLEEARSFSQEKFQEEGMSLDKVWPDFDENFQTIKKKMGESLGITRDQMPVIEPDQIDKFKEDLEEGKVDIFRPYARGHLVAPDDFSSREEAEEWIELGFEDGKASDDQVRGRVTSIPVGDLLPTQGQVWFEKPVKWAIEFGPARESFGATIIVSKGGHILDGHHRWASVHLSDPSIPMEALEVPIGIEKLLEISRSYGEALGNDRKSYKRVARRFKKEYLG
jgi:hypothetical protein